jgi:thiol-disulfide isomerase/thioredoxin
MPWIVVEMGIFAVVACRLLLAAVFALAAGTKLADRPATRVAVLGFGVPESLATVALWALIAGELLTAGLLLPAGTAWFGALAALGMLLLFCAAAGINMARGKAPECNCFGQIHSEPVGPKLFVRNAGFALLAGVIVAAGRGGVGPGMGVMFGKLSEAEALLGGLVVVLAAAVLVLALKLRSMAAAQAGLVERVEKLGHAGAAQAQAPPPGLKLGTAAPAFELSSADGTVSLAGLLKEGKAAFLVFTSPRCSACHAVMPKIKEWRERYGSKLSFVLVTSGDREANKEQEERAAGELMLFDGAKTGGAFKVAATPGAVVVGIDGKIQAEMKYGLDKITAMLLETLGEPPEPAAAEVPAPAAEASAAESDAPLTQTGRGLPIGTVAPAFELVSASGQDPFPGPAGKGKPLFLLFTSPASTDSGEAIAKVQRWAAMHGDKVGFAVMTTGGRLKLEGDGVFEARTSVGAFQVGEVPAAVLLGADGTVLSETAFGLEEIVVLFLSDVASAPLPPPVEDAGPVAAPEGDAATLEAYLAWHATTLAALDAGKAVPAGLEALVWSPRAGLGDSIFGFSAWLKLAMRSGRLFFIDLDGGDDRTWRLGFSSPGLSWDWAKHTASVKKGGVGVLPVSGHPTTGDHVVEAAEALPPLPTMDQSEFFQTVIAPSAEVQAILAEHAASFDGKRVLGLQLRTGTALPPDTAFLQAGEEAEFVSAAVEITRDADGDSWRVFIISDDEEMKSRLKGELSAAGLDPFYLESSVLHTSRDSGNAMEDEAVRQRVLRTCAEFFLFSQVDTAVITARSLFGRAALAYGGVKAKGQVGS